MFSRSLLRIVVTVCFTTDRPCEDSFQLNSRCYRVFKNERVSWFTAVTRCRSVNATLATFDDIIRQYYPISLLSDRTWIGLLRPRWIWPSLG